MKRELRGFSNSNTRSSAIGHTILTGLLAFFSTTAVGQVILDDYSTSNPSNYKFVQVFNGPADGWTVSGGQLLPLINGNASATWLWTQGETLAAMGDSVSVSLSLAAGTDNGFPNSIGLFLVPDPDSIFLGHEITQTTFGGVWGYSVDGLAQQGDSAPSGPVQLTVQRTGQTVDGFVYTVSFSGGGLPSTLKDSFTDPADSLMFGPFAFNTVGTPAAMDNLTFTAVPEPSMYAAVFGLLALVTVVFRARTARNS